MGISKPQRGKVLTWIWFSSPKIWRETKEVTYHRQFWGAFHSESYKTSVFTWWKGRSGSLVAHQDERTLPASWFSLRRFVKKLRAHAQVTEYVSQLLHPWWPTDDCINPHLQPHLYIIFHVCQLPPGTMVTGLLLCQHGHDEMKTELTIFNSVP